MMKKKTKEEFREVFTYENFKSMIDKNQQMEAQLIKTQEEMKEMKDLINQLNEREDKNFKND